MECPHLEYTYITDDVVQCDNEECLKVLVRNGVNPVLKLIV